MDKRKYTEDSIQTYDSWQHVRHRSGMYLGSNEYSTQLLKEIFYNAIDEHNIGHGNVINIVIDGNHYSVEDFGQGFLVNHVRSDGETVLQASFDVINTSGKYDDSDDSVYTGSASGLNGIGGKLTNYLSKNLIASSSDGSGKREIDYFKDGKFDKREIVTEKKGVHGTKIEWEPDEQFFQNVEINKTEFELILDEMAALCPNLVINYTVNGEAKVFSHPSGIQEIFDDEKDILPRRFVMRKEVGVELFDICLTYTSDYSESISAFVNYTKTDSGIHIQTLKTAITQMVNKAAEDIVKKKDLPILGSELLEGLTIMFNLKSKNVKYDGQTKSRIVDCNKDLINQVIRGDFYDWLVKNQACLKIIVNRALNSRKARTAAQKARDAVRGTKQKKTTLNLPTKLVDAYSKDRSECELYITEGDSAGAGLIAKRDGKTQAIFPIRGKILSCRKATIDKIFANQELNNIIKALGLEINKETSKLIYDKKKLRYDKIILTTDADADGMAIKMLLINALWWLCEDLVINGHVYVAVPPLFRITTKQNQYIFLKDEKELADYKKNHTNFTVNRNKGLGEQDAEELSYCLLEKPTRNIQQITVNDAKKADELLEIFMGQKVEPRREYLLKHQEI